jgi:hypothetical protein
LALIHLLGWWTATANILPASLFGLLTIAAFLRYRRAGVRRWIFISLLSFGLSLCTHEQSWLVVGYLFLFDLLVLAPGGRLRSALSRMWREAWIWLGYVLLTVLAMVNYFAFYYAPLKPRATIVELIRYVGIQFGQAFAPSAIGLRPLTTGWTNTVALVVDSLVFAAIVIVSIYRRPSAWRVWTVFGVGFLANAIMIGANRVGYFGVDFGVQLYYLDSPAYLFLLCVGAAFSLDASGAPYARQQEVSARPRVHASHRRPSPRFGVWGVSACVLAVGLYAFAFFTSATTMTKKDESNIESATAQTYFTRLLGQIDAATARGQGVSLVDTTVPIGVVAPAFAPANRLSYALSVVRPAAAIGRLGRSMFTVTSDARLIPVRFDRTSGTSKGLPVADVVVGSGARSSTDEEALGDGRCFTSTRPGGMITVRLSSPLTTAAGWLLLGLRTSPGAPLNVSTLNGGVNTLVGTINPAATSNEDDYVLPLSPRTFDTVALSTATAGQHVCFSSVDTGTFSAS